MTTLSCLRLLADADGVSRVQPDYAVPMEQVVFAPPAPPMWVGRTGGASAFVVIELPVGWQGGWHPSPTAQWVICLQGDMGYEAGDGTRFRLTAGRFILTQDTTGAGHNSRVEGSLPVRLALVQV